MSTERYPLPFGWVKESDQTSGHPYYVRPCFVACCGPGPDLHSFRKVDTKANPPRSIWTHPYEDEVYLKAHPDVREKLNAGGRLGGSESNLHLPSFEESQRRHSYGGPSSPSRPQPASTSAATSSKPKDRPFFGKLKDKAIGTKEEREAEKRRKREEVIRYVTRQLRFEADYLHRIVFVWKRSGNGCNKTFWPVSSSTPASPDMALGTELMDPVTGGGAAAAWVWAFQYLVVSLVACCWVKHSMETLVGETSVEETLVAVILAVSKN